MPKNPRPVRRSVLRLTHLEVRRAPAVFNMPAGDITAFRIAVTASNTNNEPDTINLAAGAIYTFGAGTDLPPDPADGGNALPTVLTDTNNAVNTLTVIVNGATMVG